MFLTLCAQRASHASVSTVSRISAAPYAIPATPFTAWACGTDCPERPAGRTARIWKHSVDRLVKQETSGRSGPQLL